MNIRLYNYNNYYNRMVKIMKETDAEYGDFIFQLLNTNFNPNDEIMTEHIFGNSMSLYYGNADYAVCIDDNNRIVSRWFVLENKRQRGGQWNITLRRDVVADFYNIIKNAPCFVEKGYVDNSSVLIYNNENMTFNQIKKGEYLLENGIGSPWLVAYLSRWHTEGGENPTQVYNEFEGTFAEDTELIANYELSSLDEYIYKKYDSEANAYIFTDNIVFGMYYQTQADIDVNGTTALDRKWGISKDGYYYDTGDYNSISQTLPIYTGNKPVMTSEELRANRYNYLLKAYNNASTIDTTTGLHINSYTGVGIFSDYVLLTEESNKIIKVDNKYYRIISHMSADQYNDNAFKSISNTGSDSLGGKIYGTLTSTTPYLWTNVESAEMKTPWIRIPYQNQGIYFTFEELNRKKIKYRFNYASNQTLQTPYEIIAAPLYSTNITKGNKTLAHNGNIALQWFLDLGEKNASGMVYDVQIVPYCSVDTLDWTDYNIAQCYVEDDIDNVLAWAVKVPLATFSHTYALDIPLESDYKIAVNCDMYRFCSPNGIGDFDFNPAKNRGLLGYEVDCTLMPFNPYIKVNPIFSEGSLYGQDWNDYRGLICGGDFSLPITNDQWETYQTNNKYYQQIFDRQVANLEVNNNWARGEAIASAGAGVVGGAAAGAVAGSVIPVLGTIAGAAIGGVAAAGGGIADIIKTFKLTEEQMSYMKDNYAYSLRTIQAKPNTLTRTTSFNQNNKYFPYIEYYTCTDEEKEIFRNKLKYDGMTIMAIGNIENYTGPETTFIKGKLIRIPDLGEDYHLANEIALEIGKGVYI